MIEADIDFNEQGLKVSEQDSVVRSSRLPELLATTDDRVSEAAEKKDDKPGSVKDDEASIQVENIDSPAKVMRIGTMLKRLLKHVRSTDLDESSRRRLREIYEVSVGEIGSVLSPDLREELNRLISSFDQPELPSAAELQIAKAQLVGWLEGLIRGMQAMLFAQQLTARRQLEAMQSELSAGSSPSQDTHVDEPSAYL